MGGVRSSGWACLLAFSSVGVLSCGRTSRNGTSNEPTPETPFMPPKIDPGTAPEPVGPDCVKAIAGYGGRFCGIDKGSMAWCFGSAEEPHPSTLALTPYPAPIVDAQSATAIALGPRHSCIVNGRGEIWCWGDNESGQIEDSALSTVSTRKVTLLPESFSSLKGFGLSDKQTCVVDPLSHVYCRGTDANGLQSASQQIYVAGEPDTTMPGANTNAVVDERGRVFWLGTWQKPEPDLSLGLDNARVFTGGPTCVLKRWGSLWCTDYRTDTTGLPLRNVLALGEDVVDAGVGDLFMCALTKQGQVWCEGFNLVGQTATGTDSTFEKGHFVEGLDDVRALAVAKSSACVIQGDGSLWCWGAYGYELKSNVPVQVSGCTEPSRAPERPKAAFVSASPDLAQRLSEASRARGQANCACLPPELQTDKCIDDEAFAPNGTCLSALGIADNARWDCLADTYWREAACFHSAGCPSSATSCPEQKACPPSTNPPLNAYCARKQCASDVHSNPDAHILKSQLCDGVADCKDGSDERNCVDTVGTFECDDQARIPLAKFCDGTPDCADETDELYCF